MSIACKHWSKGDMLNGGVCAIGSEDPEKRAKGTPRTRPGFSECDRCPHYAGPKRLGDHIERIVKPIARLINSPCLDDKDQVIPASPCGSRKAAANKIYREMFQS